MNINIKCFSSSLTRVCSIGLACVFLTGSFAIAVPELGWMSHDRNRPAPEVITPATPSIGDKVGMAPSDAIVLFDGKTLSHWVAIDGEPTKWVIREGVLECVPASGYIRTLQSFGDCQLHLEWATPVAVEGDSQGRGNSGVFFGLTRYEVQVLDSYENITYSDGSAGSIYGQYPPLVNVSLAPGEWQTYDIIFTSPRFHIDGSLKSPANVTVLHNGVLIQNHSEYTGPTAWIDRPAYSKHPVKQPIALQDHGNPVRYRNIWVRELGDTEKSEYLLPEALLDHYVGDYDRGGEIVKVRRAPDGVLTLDMAGAHLELFAESKTRFFAKTTDVLCEFDGDQSILKISVGDGWMIANKL